MSLWALKNITEIIYSKAIRNFDARR